MINMYIVAIGAHGWKADAKDNISHKGCGTSWSGQGYLLTTYHPKFAASLASAFRTCQYYTQKEPFGNVPHLGNLLLADSVPAGPI